MELAFSILKKSEITYNQDIKYDKITNFKNLKLKNINNLNDFFSLIKKDKYINATKDFLKQYFQDIDIIMVTAIQMAYGISLFSDKIFDSYKSRFEQKLIFAANKVMVIIEKLLESDNQNQKNEDISGFYSIIDNYLSLYKVWKSQDSIDSLTKLFNEFEKELKIIKIQKRRSITINTKNSKDIIDKMFKIDAKYAVRILLHNYFIFITDIQEYFWKCVKTTYEKYPEIIFITLVTELKILLIPFLKNPNDRKQIYYNIDTEDLINKISDRGLDDDLIHEIISIFKKFILPDIDVKENSKENIDLFELFYGELLMKQ